MFNNVLKDEALSVLQICKQKGLLLATAESCTGGMIAALFTEIPGYSSVYERGFITYSNRSKTELLGVDKNMIEMHGAVSEEVAVAMATGAYKRSNVDLSVSVTGIAGPDGGSENKPVGTVCIAVASNDYTRVRTYHFSGDRNAVRLQSTEAAIGMLRAALSRSFSSVA